MINKNVPIIILGFGSIGKRHYKNLLTLAYTNVAVFDPVKEAFLGFAGVVREKKFNSSVAKKYQIAFICTPPDSHVKLAAICAKAGCHLFIEKPLSPNLRGLTALDALVKKNKLITMVACNLRFHPCLAFIKDYLAKNKLGRVYSISHEFGYFLPWWRPEQDYRKNYAAKKSLGGGIILDDIHEFDLLFWLNNYAPVAEVKFIFDKISDLQITTEDICFAAFKFKNKVLGSVKCDYLQRKYTRKCQVVGEKGNLRWDIADNIVWQETRYGNKKLMALKNFDLNTMYLNEIKYFFECLKRKKETENSIAVAKSLLVNLPL